MHGAKSALNCDGRDQDRRGRRREKIWMKVLIIGAAGMIGRKLTARLVRDGKLAGKAITDRKSVV